MEKLRRPLLEPVVLGEFRKLLAPTADMTLDYALLQEEFEAAGLAVAMGQARF
ncbi:MAG: hypothetical protein H6641_09720 [Caldilineaceae bacterium]|nr:hypothetical protein [Caldilineaceae bacterium]